MFHEQVPTVQTLFIYGLPKQQLGLLEELQERARRNRSVRNDIEFLSDDLQAGGEAAGAAVGICRGTSMLGLSYLIHVVGFLIPHPKVMRACSVHRLAEKQPGLLEELQGHAKAWSNAGLLRVVFVLSDGPALSQMKRALLHNQ